MIEAYETLAQNLFNKSMDDLGEWQRNIVYNRAIELDATPAPAPIVAPMTDTELSSFTDRLAPFMATVLNEMGFTPTSTISDADWNEATRCAFNAMTAYMLELRTNEDFRNTVEARVIAAHSARAGQEG